MANHNNLYAKKIKSGSRYYYIDVTQTEQHRPYLTLTEVHVAKGRKSRIIIDPHALSKLHKALAEAQAHLDYSELPK